MSERKIENSIRLLLVEDSQAEAELITLELEHAGLVVDWRRVDNDADLRKQLREASWDLIISDFSMPRFDGMQAFEMAREIKGEIPFIFVSGALGEERAVLAMQAGARDYVLKTELERLPATVRRVLTALPETGTRKESVQSPTGQALDAVGQMAHDFNNLLAIIISYGRFAQDGVDENSPAFHDIQKILGAANDAKVLTGKLLSVSRTPRDVTPDENTIRGSGQS
jgi:DNA-binding response OmpR family regulator